MAINPIVKLQILQEAKRLLTGRRAQVASDQAAITALAPTDIDVAAANLYVPMLTAFDDALTRVNTAIAAVTVTNTDRVAFAQAAETTAKS